MTSTTLAPKIAILGAGPGGLALARLLHINDIPVAIYEVDANAASRTQGGSLDLHATTGQALIRKAGLWDEFQKHARYEGEELIIGDKHGSRDVHAKGKEGERPEIDRGALRQILLDSVPQDSIKWGHKVTSVSHGTIHLNTPNGPSIMTDLDLIIGADGAWSKVRPCLTPLKPFYSGIGGIEISLTDIDSKHPELSEMCGGGSYFALGEEEKRCLLIQRQGDRSIRIYCIDWRAEDWEKTSGIDFSKPEDVRRAFLEEYKNFTPQLQDLIRYCDDTITPRSLYMLPPGLRWASQSGLTVLGDAAHLCTPFAGIGVNAALTDAMILAEAIVEEYGNDGGMDRAVQKYEKQMFAISGKLMHMTWENLLARFNKGGIASFVERVNRGLKHEGKLERPKGVKEQEVKEQVDGAQQTVTEQVKEQVDGKWEPELGVREKLKGELEEPKDKVEKKVKDQVDEKWEKLEVAART